MTLPNMTNENAVRKAAVLVRSLDPESVAALLARLSPAEARAVRAAVRELDEVTDEDHEGILAELRGASPDRAPDGGVEFELRGPATPLGDAPTSEAPPRAPQSAATKPAPLSGLDEVDTESLVACLAREQPRTVAVVLSCLPPTRAAQVLAGLPEDHQAPALERLADLGEVDPDSLNVIAAEVEAWLAKHLQEKKRRDDRMAAVRAILAATPHTSRARLAASLQSHGRQIVDAPAPAAHEASAPPAVEPQAAPPPPIRTTPPPSPQAPAQALLSFSQLESLDPKLLGAVFARVETRTLVLALVGASDRLMRNIQRVASRRQARALRKRVATVGPVRLSDIQRAQQAVARAAAEALAAERQQPGAKA